MGLHIFEILGVKKKNTATKDSQTGRFMVRKLLPYFTN